MILEIPDGCNCSGCMFLERDLDYICKTILPEPEYLFEYIPTKVKCKNCGKKSIHYENWLSG